MSYPLGSSEEDSVIFKTLIFSLLEYYKPRGTNLSFSVPQVFVIYLFVVPSVGALPAVFQYFQFGAKEQQRVHLAYSQWMSIVDLTFPNRP